MPLLQEGLEHRDQDTKVSGTRVKAVLKLLSQEAGFLVDPGVKVTKKERGQQRYIAFFSFKFCNAET